MKSRVRRQLDRLSRLSPPLIVVGCHRSGTSMLVTVLREHGCFFGDDLISHQESKFFLRCNEYLLKRVHASWDRPRPWLECGPEGTDPDELLTRARIDHEVVPYQFMGLRSYLKMRYGRFRAWGWKDPRTSVTLPLWLRMFPEARVLHICRHGLDVALSLNKRELSRESGSAFYAPDLLKLRHCFSLWKVYEEAIAAHVAPLPATRYARIRYEDMVAFDAATVERLQTFLGCSLDLQRSPLKTEHAGKFRTELGEGARDYLEDPLLRQLGYV